MFQISFQKPRILSWKVIIALLFLALLTTGTIVYSLEATSQTLSLEESRLIVTSGDADSAEQIQSPTFELTSINLPSTRLPNYIPTDIPREAAGAVIEQNYIAYDDLGEEGYRFQGTRVFRTNATLDEEFNRYLAYFNSRNYQILTTSNQPDFKSIFVRPAPTSSIFGSININRNTITNIRSVDITFQNNNFSCSTPPSGLISWYYGEGNANDSFGVNNGILRNGATATDTGSAGHGLAFGFDGVDDYVEIPDSSSLKPQQISVEAWVKFTSLNSTNPSAPGLQYIVFKKNRRADHFEGYSLSKFRDTNGVERIGFTIASAGGNQISARSTSPVTVNANIRNQFYHLVGTYDGSTVRLYVNGELEGIQAANFALDYDTRPLFIGGSGESFNGRMQGVIDEVGIYNRAVTANEVRRIFESGGAGKCRQIPNNPVLSVNPSSGTQQATTFTYNGGWFTPNGAIRQFLTYPNGTTQELAGVSANGSGAFTAYYPTSCANPIGNYSLRVQDVSTSRQSNIVPLTISESPGCFLAQTVNELEPKVVTLNTRTKLTVKGTNFGQPFNASVTTPEGTFNIQPGDLQFVSATEVNVWVNMGGTSAYNATLRLDFIRSSVTRSFQVIPSTPAPVIDFVTTPVTANQVAPLTVDGSNFQNNFRAFIITPDGTFELLSGNKRFINTTKIELDVVMRGSPPYTATVKIQNPDQQFATRNFQVIVQTQPPPKPVQVLGIEVTQAVQDLRNEVPLISDKKTYVRVHAKSNTSTDISNVRANLSGTRIEGNTRISLGRLPAVERTLKRSPNRNSLDDSFLFILPNDQSNSFNNWTRGTVELQFEGASHDFEYNEADGSRDGKVQVNFRTAPELEITILSVFWKNIFGERFEPSSEELNKVEQDLRIMLPTARFKFSRTSLQSPRSLRRPTGQPYFDSDYLSELNAAILNRRMSDGCYTGNGCKKIYLGIVSRQSVNGSHCIPFTDCRSGVTGLTISYAPVPQCSDFLRSDVSSSFADVTRFTHLHEIGHALGRWHTNFTGSEDYPCHHDPGDGTIGGREISQFLSSAVAGFDGNNTFASASPDLMSYGSNRWISKHTYWNILDHITERFGSSVKAIDKSQIMIQKGENTLLVSGNITNNQQNGELSTIYKIPSPIDVPFSGTGNYRINFFGADNQEIASYAFEPQFGLEGGIGAFAMLLPEYPNAARLSLLKNGQVLASRQASANPPLVTVTYPNGGETLNTPTVNLQWTASDADGDALRYLVQYSSNAGADWETIVSDLDSTSYEINLNSIAGTNQGLFRVIASDGYYSGLDQFDAHFGVNTHAPQATISSPLNNSYFVGDQNIALSGSAFDLEDGQLNDDSLLWSSDLEGSLGAGQNLSINASALREGTHNITLTARDSSAQTGTASLIIRVYRTQPPIPTTLNASPSSLSFIARQGTTNLSPPQILAVRNEGEGSLNWSADANQPWIKIVETTGTAPSNVEIKVDPSGLAIGNYTGTITVTTPNAANSPQTVNVSLAIVSYAVPRAPYDFDGDGRTDIGVWRASSGSWWYLHSSDLSGHGHSFGLPDDIITPGDFTGDGKTDVAIWRPSTGEWFVRRSEDGSYFSYQFGLTGDIPAPADYDGDGITDTATFRPSTATWYIFQSSTGTFGIVTFGLDGDRPVPADYDGDGKADIMVWRPSNGTWWIVKSSNLEQRGYGFGTSTDRPVVGDYTGDGKADIAVWRDSTREWFFLRSEDGSYYSYPSGLSGDIPAPGDYDGDGKFDSAVFRPSTQTWYIDGSTAGSMIATFGLNGDRPVANAFVP